jgi:hypothetical protein
VTVSFTCTAAVLPLSGPCPAAVTLAHSGPDQTVTRFAHDTGGGTAMVTVGDLDIDTDAPHVAITGVKKGKTYGHKRKPKCKAGDIISGLASCKLTQKKKGTKITVTATATDKAGNVATTKLTYKVKPRHK